MKDVAEKPHPGLNRDTETTSSEPTKEIMNLDELQKKAYYEVLQAFAAESSAISAPKILILKELKKTWKISQTTHLALEKKLETDTLVQELRKSSQPEGTEKVNEQNQESFMVAPAKIPEEKAEPSSTTPQDSLIPSWGDVSPASIVKKWVNIRISSENDYVAFLITDYDAETEMHQLVTSPSKKERKDPCDWIDIRYFTPEDIVWQEGHPGIPIHKRSLKQGETILHATSTAREKKPIKEIRKAASGIPVITKHDKGKSIA